MTGKTTYVYGARSKTFLSGSPYYLARALESFGKKSKTFEVVDVAPKRAIEIPFTYMRWRLEAATHRVPLFLLSQRYHNRSGQSLKASKKTRPYFVVCSQQIPESIIAVRKARPESRIIVYIDATLLDLIDYFDYASAPPPQLQQKMLQDEKRGYDLTDLFAVFHEGVRARLISDYGIPPEKIWAIGRGINFDFEYASQLKIEKKSRLDNKFHMMVVGRGPKRKGVFKLIEAIDSLTPEEQNRLVLTVAGPEPTELPSRSYLRPLGFVSAEQRDQLTQEMASCDLGVLLSNADSLPGSVWEFIALGLPVWVSELPGIAKALSGYPAIIEDLSLGTPALAARLRSFLYQPEIIENLLATNKRSPKDLAWDVQAEFIGQYIASESEKAPECSVGLEARYGSSPVA